MDVQIAIAFGMFTSGLTMGWVFDQWWKQSKPRKVDYNEPDLFVTEYIEQTNRGPVIIRLPLAQWPEWADKVNPMKKKA